MSRSSLTVLAVLALLLAGGVTLWSLPGPSPRAAAPATRTTGPAAQASAPVLAAPLESPAPDPPPPEETEAVLPDPPASRVAVPRPEAASAPPWSAGLEVLVLDARTGQGLPFMRVRAREGRRIVWSQADRSGVARLSQAFEAGSIELRLHDGLTFQRLETTVSHSSPPGGGTPPAFEWPIDIGPTYGLRVAAPSASESSALKARLCEVGAGGELRTWSSQSLSGQLEQQRWIRYKQIEHEPGSGWRPVLRVWAPGTFLSGEVSVPATVGLHEHLSVALRPTAGGFRGRVTDAKGHPVSAQVIVLGGRPLGSGFDETDRDWLDLETDGEGRFEAGAVAPGTHQVLVCSSQRPLARSEVSIALGEVTERAFVVGSRADSAGDVRGTLVSRPGAGEPIAMLELDSVDGGGVSRVAGTAWEFLGRDPDGEERSAYEFTDLPRGRYRVRVVPLDGRIYVPSEQVVEVPAAGVNFSTAQTLEEAKADYWLEVTDAETGDQVAGASMLLRLGSYWMVEAGELRGEPGISEGPSEIEAEVLIGAPGYVPARVAARDYARVGTTREYRVRLRRGHGAALVVVDAEAAQAFDDTFRAGGVPGARVLVDGHEVSPTPEGLALIEAASPIESIQVEAPGWVMLDLLHFDARAHGLGFVLMARE